MPNRNLDAPILSLDGKPIAKDADGSGQAAMKDVIVFQLLNSDIGKPSGVAKAARFALAMRLHKGGECDLTAEELALIKQLVGESYAPAIVGPVFQWADA